MHTVTRCNDKDTAHERFSSYKIILQLHCPIKTTENLRTSKRIRMNVQQMQAVVRDESVSKKSMSTKHENTKQQETFKLSVRVLASSSNGKQKTSEGPANVVVHVAHEQQAVLAIINVQRQVSVL